MLDRSSRSCSISDEPSSLARHVAVAVGLQRTLQSACGCSTLPLACKFIRAQISLPTKLMLHAGASGAAAAALNLHGRASGPSSSVAAAGSQLWVEKHKPQTSADLVGNGTVIATLKQWLQEWCAPRLRAAQCTMLCTRDHWEHRCNELSLQLADPGGAPLRLHAFLYSIRVCNTGFSCGDSAERILAQG